MEVAWFTKKMRKKHTLILLTLVLVIISGVSATEPTEPTEPAAEPTEPATEPTGPITQYISDYMVESWNHTTKEPLSGLVVSNIDGRQGMEVLASASSEGAVYALDFEGNLKWKYNVPGYVFDVHADDVDGDGIKEVFTGTTNHFYAIDDEGNLKWKYYTGADKIQTLATADVNSDGIPDIVVGTASGGCKSNTLYVTNGSGKNIWGPYDLGRYYPSAITSFRSNGSLRVVVGSIFVTRHMASSKCLPSRETKSRVIALDGERNMVWMYNTSGGVTVVHTEDLDGDGRVEVLVGSYPNFYLLSENGVLLWNYTAVSRVDSLSSGDLDGDGIKEVVVGSDDIYVFHLNGSIIWRSGTHTRYYALYVGDLDRDGSAEVVGGSDRIYVFGGDGGLKWKSDSFVSVYLLGGGDLDGDGYIEVVGGATEKILVYKTTSHVKFIEANTYYSAAKNLYASGNLERALNYSRIARDLYSVVGEEDEVSKTMSLITLIEGRLNYTRSLKLEADAYLNMSQDSYASMDFYNATWHARIAKAKYLSPEVDDREKAVECDVIINKSLRMLSINVGELTSKAGEDYLAGDYDDALFYAKEARKIYELLGDEENFGRMDGMVSEIEEKTRRPIIDARVGFLGNQSILEYSENKIRSMKAGDYGFAIVFLIAAVLLLSFLISSIKKFIRALRRKKLDVRELDKPIKSLDLEK